MEQQVFDNDFFKKLNTLTLSVHMRLNQGMGGIRKSTAKGSSVEFSDFREYQLGDDIRRIDWNAYGRMDKLFIKQFMEEKEGMFHIFLDTSESMQFGSIPKSRLALQITAALSYIVLNNLDRVSVNQMKENSLMCGKGLTGRNAFKSLLHDLEQIQFTGGTTLSRDIKSRPIHKRGTSIIISDFLDPKGIEDAISYLSYQHQEMILIQILAKEEQEILLEGTMNIVDMETGERVRVTANRASVLAYEKKLKDLKDELNRMAGKYHMTYLFASSEQSVDQVLFEGLQAKGIVTTK